MRINRLDEASLLECELEIFSASDLKPLADALRKKVGVHYLGKEFDRHKPYFELSRPPKTLGSAIIRYGKLIQDLPPVQRKLWDEAESRSFDIEFEAPTMGVITGVL